MAGLRRGRIASVRDDLRAAVRGVKRGGWLPGVVILTLAVAIGEVTAIVITQRPLWIGATS